MTTFYDLPPPSTDDIQRSEQLSLYLQKILPKQGFTFADYMQQVLYHPQWGYYNRDNITIGADGDFTTAPELSPLFAQSVAKQCAQIFSETAIFNILEIGAGTGKLALDLITALQSQAISPHYFIFEPSQALRRQQVKLLTPFAHLITWLDKLPAAFEGIMIANEVLDALPVNCFKIESGKIFEKKVSWDGQRFAWNTQPIQDPALISALQAVRDCHVLPDAYESEINLNLFPFIQKLTTSLKCGIILFLDYGYGSAEYYHPERAKGTLTCFYQHHRTCSPFFYPGLQDITAHVNFTSVAKIAVQMGCQVRGYTSQSVFLLNCGLSELAESYLSTLNVAAQLKANNALKKLIFPTEMGERIKVMALSKDCEQALLGFSHGDRRRDL